MRIGAFQIEEPVPKLHYPHALAVLQPWIDAGNAASSVITMLERHLEASLLGKLRVPGAFFDFTRYRPHVRLLEGHHQTEIPNTFINYARWTYGDDFIFLHLMEPHMLSEVYISSVLDVLQKFGVRRYLLLGAMYDSFPHTKPLVVSGIMEGTMRQELREAAVEDSNYEGPTTITMRIAQMAAILGIEVATIVVHLPQYMQFEHDWAGKLRLLEVLYSLYSFNIDLTPVRAEAERQYAQVSLTISREPYLKKIVERLEAYYEARKIEKDSKQVELSPEIQEYLNDINDKFNWD
jgi:predicted ATP-grasp superfamily ATP-dependent carboligase